MKTPIIPLLLVLMAPQNALGQETGYYLMKARTMGSGVPAGLNQEVLTKIRRTVSKHNRLVVEGEQQPRVVPKAEGAGSLAGFCGARLRNRGNAFAVAHGFVPAAPPELAVPEGCTESLCLLGRFE